MNMSQRTVIYTVCNLAYLHKALALSESVAKYCSEEMIIYLFEEEFPEIIGKLSENAKIVLAKSIGYERFYELAFKYDVTEFTTSLKPYIAMKLLDSYDNVIFMDPDTFVVDNFSELKVILSENEIIVTPHYLTPQTLCEDSDPDLMMMRFGSFNLGFFAVRNSLESKRFLNWWHDRCVDQCFFETQFGLSTDQKWISIAPCFFDRLYILRHPGYNFAYWNMFERRLEKRDDKYLVNGSYRLFFVHFSNFNSSFPEQITSRARVKSEVVSKDLVELAYIYKSRCDYFSERLRSVDQRYSYNCFSDGIEISISLRRAYASKIDNFTINENPFLSSSKVYSFAKRNHLLSRRAGKYKPAGISEVERYGFWFQGVYFLMRVALLILGPAKFNDLSRLFVYLSSYRKLSDFWRA